MQRQTTIFEKQDSRSLSKQKKVSKSKKVMEERQEKFHVFLTPGDNQIWLSSLGFAWKELTGKYGFKPELPEGSRAAPQTIEGFIGNSCTQDDVDSESVYFKGGIKNEIVQTINHDLNTKFSSFNIQKIDPIKSNEAILFGGLFKILKLKYPLFQIPGKIMHFKGLKVPCFEPMEKEQKQQIKVVKYTGQDNFVIRINLAEQDSYMFVIRTKEKLDIKSAIQIVMNTKQDLPCLSDEDVFKIPQLKIKVSQYLSEIVGIKGRVQGQEKAVEIIDCFEAIHLEMKGQPHRQRMDIMTLTVSEEDKPSLHSRRMAVRGPFWLILQRKGKYPYLIMYINKHDQQFQ